MPLTYPKNALPMGGLRAILFADPGASILVFSAKFMPLFHRMYSWMHIQVHLENGR